MLPQPKSLGHEDTRFKTEEEIEIEELIANSQWEILGHKLYYFWLPIILIGGAMVFFACQLHFYITK